MRKTLIKFLVGMKRLKIGNKWITFPKAGLVLIPAILLTGLMLLHFDPKPTIDIIAAVNTLLIIWFGFFHFEKFPVKWDELSDEQKWDLGILFLKTLKSKAYFKEEKHYQEWVSLDLHFSEKYGIPAGISKDDK